jgi:hypothetical protein
VEAERHFPVTSTIKSVKSAVNIILQVRAAMKIESSASVLRKSIRPEAN